MKGRTVAGLVISLALSAATAAAQNQSGAQPYEQFALARPGDAKRGRELFRDDKFRKGTGALLEISWQSHAILWRGVASAPHGDRSLVSVLIGQRHFRRTGGHK